jgi:hypothetical protein
VIDDTRSWLEDYQEVAKPRVPVADIAREMSRRHPDRALPLLFWLTRGPSFGLVGPKELGVPPGGVRGLIPVVRTTQRTFGAPAGVVPWRAPEVLQPALTWADAGPGRWWVRSAETEASVMPVSSQVSMVPRAVHGNCGVLLSAGASEFLYHPGPLGTAGSPGRPVTAAVPSSRCAASLSPG